MKTAGWIFIVIGVLSFLGAVVGESSVFGPCFWFALGILLVYMANRKKEKAVKDEEKLQYEHEPIQKQVEELVANNCKGNLKNENKMEERESVPAANVYSKLTNKQKMAAMNLMIVFGGGSCSGMPHELDKIDHIMSVEGKEMGLSGEQVRTGQSMFSGMKDMVNALKGADRAALEKLFWTYYCIVAVGKSEQAVIGLLGVYDELGFSQEQCQSILEKRTGIKLA